MIDLVKNGSCRLKTIAQSKVRQIRLSLARGGRDGVGIRDQRSRKRR
jgi:hypothetical protein